MDRIHIAFRKVDAAPSGREPKCHEDYIVDRHRGRRLALSALCLSCVSASTKERAGRRTQARASGGLTSTFLFVPRGTEVAEIAADDCVEVVV